jgi:hypothetical protein
MSEEPIKLFATRAEGYPQPDDGDTARAALEKVIDQFPVAGPVINFVFSHFLPPLLERRRDEFFKDLASAVERLEQKHLLNVEELVLNELFVTAVVQAARTAINNHQREKLEALRNAVLSVALSRTWDEEKCLVFLHLIEIFSVTHLEILRLFANPVAFPATRRDELRQRRSLTDPMVLDLNDRGLLIDPRPYVARTRESNDSLTIQGWTLSALGKEFMSFIAYPEQLK